jgi:hypothetical protein
MGSLESKLHNNMKKMLLKFSDSLLSREQTKVIKGGYDNIDGTSGGNGSGIPGGYATFRNNSGGWLTIGVPSCSASNITSVGLPPDYYFVFCS